MKGLELVNLSVQTTGGKPIIRDLSMKFLDNERYALLGENGAGKSSLISAIMGHPGYKITTGKILLDGEDITRLSPDQRARKGLFLAMQYPVEITGVSYASFLRTVIARLTDNKTNFLDVLENLQREAANLGFRDFDYNRDLNVGFSGGEKKKSEILQMLMIKPRFAFLDEPDSGLDKKSVGLLAERLANLGYPSTLVIISHHDRLLAAVNPSETYMLERN